MPSIVCYSSSLIFFFEDAACINYFSSLNFIVWGITPKVPNGKKIQIAYKGKGKEQSVEV